MKPTEREFLAAVKALPNGRFPREVCERFHTDRGVPLKRLHYWLDKWVNKGWYEYGVSIDMGWLTGVAG